MEIMGDMAGSRGTCEEQNAPELPRRWLSCPRKATGLVRKKFLVFKTPLGCQFDSLLSPSSSFSPELLMGSVRTRKIKLGLWVDLTDGEPLYDPAYVTAQGAKYAKLPCTGDGNPPTEEMTTAFVGMCHQFISMNPLEIVGVHSTLGFNRAGFLVIAYLIEKEDWALDRAIYEFSRWRSPGVFDRVFMEELHRRYGDAGDQPPRSAMAPEWFYEERASSSAVVEMDSEAVDPPNQRHVPGGLKLCEIPGIRLIGETQLSDQVVGKVRALLGYESSILFPVWDDLDRSNIEELRRRPYMLAWVGLGVRCYILIDGVDQVFLVDPGEKVYQVPNLRFPKRLDRNGHLIDTILEGEMVMERVQGRAVYRLIISDVAKFGGGDVENRDFDARLKCMTDEIFNPRARCIRQGRINKATEPFSVRLKTFTETKNIEALFSEAVKQKLGYKALALLFQKVGEPHKSPASHCRILWKPVEEDEAFFRLKVREKILVEGSPPVETAELYLPGQEDPFSEVVFMEMLKTLDGQIIKCDFDAIMNVWKFSRCAKPDEDPSFEPPAEDGTISKDELVNSLVPKPEEEEEQDAMLMPPPSAPKEKRPASSPTPPPGPSDDGFAVPAPPAKISRLSS